MKIYRPKTEKEIALERAKDLVVIPAPEEYYEQMRDNVIIAKLLLKDKAAELKIRNDEIKILYDFVKENEHLL